MSLDIYYLGEVLPDFIGDPEAMRWDLEYQEIFITLSRENIEKYPLNGPFEFRFITVYNTIFLLMRYGNMPWMSAPFSPCISGTFEKKNFPKGKGALFAVIQVCNEDGRIHDISAVTLTNEVSNLINLEADRVQNTIPFDLEEHKSVIYEVYTSFSSDEELADVCPEESRCTII